MANRTELTTMQEKFCRLMAEGKLTQYQCADQAGYNPGANNLNKRIAASRLAKQPKVKARIAELLAEATYHTGVTIGSIAKEIDQAWELARDDKNPEAMITASMAKAKLYGLVNDKPQVDITVLNKPMWTPGPMLEMSVDEWAAEFSPKEIGHG
jgi:hypothetical protein